MENAASTTTSIVGERDGLVTSMRPDLHGSYYVVHDAENVPTDLIFKHWKALWQAKLQSDSGLRQDARELTEHFVSRAFSKQLRFRTFVARRISSQAIIGSICCQLWEGPVPISVVDRSVFSIGTIWGLYVEGSHAHESSSDTKRVSEALIEKAKAYLQQLKCKKAVVLAFDNWDQTCFLNAGFQRGNMLTLRLDDDFVCQTPNDLSLEIHHEGQQSDEIVCSHWRKMWQEVRIPETGLVAKFDEITHAFLQDARTRLGYQTIVAKTNGGDVVGSVSCQIWEGPFPKIVRPDVFQYGTIWAVYVNPEYRRKGVATALMGSAVNHLRGLGCDTAILIAASQAGQCVYERLGFAPNNALVCNLSSAASMTKLESPTPALCEELGKRLTSLGVTSIDSSMLPALATATARQLLAVFDDGYPQRDLIFQAVSDIQANHDIYIDPANNWFTKNVKRFGRGFDMKSLAANTNILASKFDRLSTHYDHWTVGNLSKVEAFVVKCSKTRLPKLQREQKCRLLDIACGIGLQGQTLRLCGYDGELVGTDISSGMIARVLARGCYDHAYVANANGDLVKESMPSNVAAKRLFDVVLCTGAMELLDQPRALASMASALKPDGELWVSFQYDESSEHEAIFETSTTNPTDHQNICGISRAKAREQLAEAGFRGIVSMEVCHDAFYTPSPKQNGTLLPVPYLFVVAEKR